MSEPLKLVYTDTFEHAFDEKGRLTVPKEWRGDGFETRLYIAPPDPDAAKPCLSVYPGSWLASKLQQIETYPIGDVRRKKFESMAPLIQSVEMDQQNRISIKDKLRLQAGLKKNAVLVGRFGHFEIWDPEQRKSDADASLSLETILKEAGL